MAFKHYLRELLGLTIVVSVVFGVLSILLDFCALAVLCEHQENIAHIFFHESFYFVAFLIPPYFLWKVINRPDLVAATEEYQANKLELERS
ncbi:D-fructose-6-phosphate amidotransferase [Vibrio campbellii]|uniref:D-fructose-6-phosphate amidotransferase n=1 Tax=Vibrio campbellii TaxID=680 RepID=UPI000CF37FA3|nr:D-fructose-6-phosphate amidotransferase [Vibrio campbellii]PQJ45072.1 D-fructose-6-phosphate amidotransferase [Vibrio campbellii]